MPKSVRTHRSFSFEYKTFPGLRSLRVRVRVRFRVRVRVRVRVRARIRSRVRVRPHDDSLRMNKG